MTPSILTTTLTDEYHYSPHFVDGKNEVRDEDELAQGQPASECPHLDLDSSRLAPEFALTTSGASRAVRTQGPEVRSPQPTALQETLRPRGRIWLSRPPQSVTSHAHHPAGFPAGSTPEPRTFGRASSHIQTAGLSDIAGLCHSPVFRIPHSREASLEKVLWVGKLRAKDMNDAGSENAARLMDCKAGRVGAGEPARDPRGSFRVRPPLLHTLPAFLCPALRSGG